MATLRFSGDVESANREIARLMGRLSKMEDQLRHVRRECKGAKEDFEGSFGAGMLNRVTSMAAGFFSLQTAISAAAGALRELKNIQGSAGGRIVDAESGRRELAQVAKDQADFQRLTKMSDDIRTQLGIPADKSNQIVFNARSAGLDDKAMFFARLSQYGFEPNDAIAGTLALQQNFGGAGEGNTGAGSAEQVASKFAAASVGAKLKASQIGPLAADAAEAFASIGGGDEELLGIIGLMSNVVGQPGTIPEKIKSLSRALKKKQDEGLAPTNIGGMNLINAIPELAKQQGLTPAQFLGDANAISGYNLIQKLNKESNLPGYIESIRQAERDSGTPNDALGKIQGIVTGDRQLVAAEQKRISQQRKELSEEEAFGDTANLLAAVEADQSAAAARRGEGSSFMHSVKEKMRWMNYWGWTQSGDLQSRINSNIGDVGTDTLRSVRSHYDAQGMGDSDLSRRIDEELARRGEDLMTRQEALLERQEQMVERQIQAAEQMMAGNGLR